MTRTRTRTFLAALALSAASAALAVPAAAAQSAGDGSGALTVYFGDGRDTLRGAEMKKVKESFRPVMRCSGLRVEIDSFDDTAGTAEESRAIAQRRAEQLGGYLRGYTNLTRANLSINALGEQAWIEQGAADGTESQDQRRMDIRYTCPPKR